MFWKPLNNSSTTPMPVYEIELLKTEAPIESCVKAYILLSLFRNLEFMFDRTIVNENNAYFDVHFVDHPALTDYCTYIPRAIKIIPIVPVSAMHFNTRNNEMDVKLATGPFTDIVVF